MKEKGLITFSIARKEALNRVSSSENPRVIEEVKSKFEEFYGDSVLGNEIKPGVFEINKTEMMKAINTRLNEIIDNTHKNSKLYHEGIDVVFQLDELQRIVNGVEEGPRFNIYRKETSYMDVKNAKETYLYLELNDFRNDKNEKFYLVVEKE